MTKTVTTHYYQYRNKFLFLIYEHFVYNVGKAVDRRCPSNQTVDSRCPSDQTVDRRCPSGQAVDRRCPSGQADYQTCHKVVECRCSKDGNNNTR